MLHPMAFTPEQYLQIAASYEKAAADYTVPPQHRNAFARKAEWFRLLARVAAKPKCSETRERAVTDSPHSGLQMLSKAHYLFAWQQHSTELRR
jgi:hypothetical protein